MNKSLNLFQTFNAMRIFLNLYCEQNKADDIAMLLGGLHLANNYENWQDNPRTWDPPAWDDWMNGVHKTLQDLCITQDPKNVLYDTKTAFLCMKNYLQLFYEQFPFQDIDNLLKLLSTTNDVTDNTMWNMWLQAMHHSLHESYELDGWH